MASRPLSAPVTPGAPRGQSHWRPEKRVPARHLHWSALQTPPGPPPRKASPCAPHACSGAPRAARLHLRAARCPPCRGSDAPSAHSARLLPRQPASSGCDTQRPARPPRWPRAPPPAACEPSPLIGVGVLSQPPGSHLFIGEGPNRAAVGSLGGGLRGCDLKAGWLPGRGAWGVGGTAAIVAAGAGVVSPRA